MTTSTSEPKLGYANALKEARSWILGEDEPDITIEWDDIPPYEQLFVSWYAWNARKYTFDSAWDFYYNGKSASLVLRPGEGEVPSPDVRGEWVLYGPDESGRPTVLAPGSRSIPEGVVLWGGPSKTQ